MRRITIPLLLAATLTACTPSTPQTPATLTPQPAAADPDTLLAILAGTSNPEPSRRAADARLVSLKGKTDPARLAVLEQLLYAHGHSDAMRIYAMDQLADADPARAGNLLQLYFPRFEGQVLDHACELAIRLGDPRLTDALIRSLARAADHPDKRPEWHALEKLSGKSTVEVLYTAVEKSPIPSVRIAALDILQPYTIHEKMIAWIKGIPGSGPDGWLGDIKWWAAKFDALPHGPDENTWVHSLALPQNASLFRRAYARHLALRDQPDYQIAPRFITTLAAIDDATAALDRPALLEKIRTELAKQSHASRKPEDPGAADDRDQSLDAKGKNLTRCDLFAILLLLNNLNDPALIAELHRQGLADLSDTTTEHGGLLLLAQNKLEPRPYPTASADNDFDYVTPETLTRDTVNGLAQYHFHFQQIHNTDRAGPGPGDLDYAKSARTNAVVITSIDTRKINIDYYTPNGAVVDLGTYEAAP
jgi:hypothetical protein